MEEVEKGGSSLNPIKIVEEHVNEEVKDLKQSSDVSHKEPIKEEKSEESQDEEAIEFNLKERKEKTLKFLKKKGDWIFYLILAFITYISIFIRTRNLGGLRDVTTGTWTLGPDLDPFLFLRWSKYIVENGVLFATDMMRYAPLGYPTNVELLLHPYMMAWFHKIASIFGSESITHSAVLYPVFFFALTVIAFFLMTRKIFLESMGKEKASIIPAIVLGSKGGRTVIKKDPMSAIMLAFSFPIDSKNIFLVIRKKAITVSAKKKTG